MRSTFVGLLVMGGTCLAATMDAAGQVRVASRQTQQGKFVDGILRELVDSHSMFQPSRPLSPVPSSSVSPQMQQVRGSLEAFAREAGQLITALRLEERYAPNLRPMLGDALRIKATADVLARQSGNLAETDAVARDYANLDRQWRLLAHQIGQSPNLGTPVLDRVAALNRANDALGRILKLDPQLELEDVVHHLVTLNADFDDLAEDIRIDLYEHAQRDAWVNRLREMRTRVQQLRMAATSRYPHQDLVRYYKQFYDAWLPLKRELRSIDNRYVHRNITRITRSNERLHELLWLPPVIDGRDILYLADTLKNNVDKVCDEVSLKKLIGLPNAESVLGNAREFYTLCGAFRQTVAREKELENVRWDFRELDVAWNDLRQAMGPMRDPTATRQLAFIDQSVTGLRNSLGLRSVVDREDAIQLASTLNNMTDLLYYDMNRFVGRSARYPQDFRRQAVGSSSDLRKLAGTLLQSVSATTGDVNVRQQCQQLASEWHELQQYIAKIPVREREEIARTCQNIAPTVAKLQMMYAY